MSEALHAPAPSRLASVTPPAAPDPEPASLLDGLRARHDRVTAATTVKVLIAGYKQPQLAAEYRLLPPEESKKVGEQIMDEFSSDADRLLYSSFDVLVDSLIGFHARGGPADEFAPLLDDGDAVTNYGHLAELLGHQTDTARDAVVAVFMGNANSAVAHSQTVQRWMNDTSIGLDKDFLGEA